MPTPIQRILTALCALGVSACTLITDATERKVVDGQRDLNFTFQSMAVHQGTPLDVAIVNQDDVLQGRARVILPPDRGGDYPDVTVNMKQALPSGKNRLFFFIDNNDNNLVDSAANAVLEHVWIEDVPSSGTGSFKHSINFKPFTEDDYQSLNGDLVLEGPDAKQPIARRCVLELFTNAVKEELVIHILLAEEGREIGYFKTFPESPVPEKVVLPGIIDAPNEYTVELFIDGERKNSVNLSAEVDQALVVPATRWFPANARDIAECIAAQQ